MSERARSIEICMPTVESFNDSEAFKGYSLPDEEPNSEGHGVLWNRGYLPVGVVEWRPIRATSHY